MKVISTREILVVFSFSIIPALATSHQLQRQETQSETVAINATEVQRKQVNQSSVAEADATIQSLLGIQLGAGESSLFENKNFASETFRRRTRVFEQYQDEGVECRCARNLRLATPFRSFESVNVYSTSDTKKIYKIELVYYGKKDVAVVLLSEGEKAALSLVVSHLEEFQAIMKILVGKYLTTDKTHKRKVDQHEIHDEDGETIGIVFEIKAGNSCLKLESNVPVFTKGPGQILSTRLSLCDVMLLKGSQELTRQKKEEELKRQNFIENGGLL